MTVPATDNELVVKKKRSPSTAVKASALKKKFLHMPENRILYGTEKDREALDEACTVFAVAEAANAKAGGIVNQMRSDFIE